MTDPRPQDLEIIARLLKTIDLFKDMADNVHDEIVQHITLEYYPEKYAIFKEGEVGDRMFIIKNGMVRVYHEGPSESFDKEIAILGDNDFFGEMALISDNPRNATAMTIEPTQAFVIKKEDFETLLSNHPHAAEKISSEYLVRFKENSRS